MTFKYNYLFKDFWRQKATFTASAAFPFAPHPIKHRFNRHLIPHPVMQGRPPAFITGTDLRASKHAETQ